MKPIGDETIEEVYLGCRVGGIYSGDFIDTFMFSAHESIMYITSKRVVLEPKFPESEKEKALKKLMLNIIGTLGQVPTLLKKHLIEIEMFNPNNEAISIPLGLIDREKTIDKFNGSKVLSIFLVDKCIPILMRDIDAAFDAHFNICKEPYHPPVK